jgi:hypothetical protein
MYNIYIIILIIILIIHYLNNTPIQNHTRPINNNNSGTIEHQYNSPIQKQINNVIYVTNEESNRQSHKFGTHPYSKYLSLDDNKFKMNKIGSGSGSFSRFNYSR